MVGSITFYDFCCFRCVTRRYTVKLKLTLTLTLTLTDTGGAVVTLILGYRSLYITWQ